MSNFNDYENNNFENENNADNSGFFPETPNAAVSDAEDSVRNGNEQCGYSERPIDTESEQHTDNEINKDIAEEEFNAVASNTEVCDSEASNFEENDFEKKDLNEIKVEETDLQKNDDGSSIGESTGIRYDTDKESNDGNYTWKYCGNELQEKTSERKRKRKGAVLKITAAVAMSVLVVGASFATSFLYFKSYYNGVDVDNNVVEKSDLPVIGKNTDASSKESTQPISVIEKNEDGSLSKQAIALKCKPSSVGIEIKTVTKGFYGYTYQSTGVGSGFILTEDGYIATNHHVIENASSITVMLDDGTTVDAELVGSDSLTDLAVIKIDANEVEYDLVPMEIGDSDKMRVGDSVIAIGTPAGIEFAGTVTDGIVSAINRDVELQTDSGSTKTMTLMQTNAAINPGNSGGPLINDHGQVIGINTLKLTSDFEGIGFSIPINSAVKIFNQLIADGKVTSYEDSFVSGNGAIGITKYVEVTEEESKFYGIPCGIMVIQLDTSSASYAAGLKRGDIITAFNGTECATVEELNKLKSKFKAGDEVTITVYRDSDEKTDITFKLDIMN